MSESKNPPLKSPLLETNECSSEKKYISLVKRERELDGLVHCCDVHVGVGEINNNNTSREIYKTINTVIPQRKRTYRKNIIRYRCQQFAQDLVNAGFPEGWQFDKKELRHWIIALDLAHDKNTVDQYFERLVIYNYFFLHDNGSYELVRVLPEGQFTLLDPRRIQKKLRASLRKPRRRAF